MHTRKITVMCILSASGRNTAVILQGNGISPRLFEDTETRDNGMIRKYNLHIYFQLQKISFNLISFY